MREKIHGLLADAGLLYAAAIWGATFFVVKYSLEYIDPLLLLAYRFTLAALLLGIALKSKEISIWRCWNKGISLGIVLWCLYVPQTIGLRYTSASSSGFITGLFVAFMPIFYLLFYRRLPTLTRLLAVLVSLSGLWLLTGGLEDVNLGDLLTIASSIFYALHIIIADKFVKAGEDPYVLSFQQFLTVGVLSFICVVVFGLPIELIDISVGWVVVFLALFPTLSAFVIQLVAQKDVAPLRVSIIFATEPLFAAIFAWTLGGEVINPIKAFGGILIVLAIVVSELNFRKK